MISSAINLFGAGGIFSFSPGSPSFFLVVAVTICENLKSLKGANVNTNSDNIEIFSVKLDITGWSNNQLTVSQIAKWVLSASGITKDASVNTVTEIWGKK